MIITAIFENVMATAFNLKSGSDNTTNHIVKLRCWVEVSAGTSHSDDTDKVC